MAGIRLIGRIEHESPVEVALRPCSVPRVDAFERYVRAGLELQGIAVDDVDIAVMRAADATYGPAMRALAAADLREVLPEPDLDPGRAPREP
jgi:hypothetical protein